MKSENVNQNPRPWLNTDGSMLSDEKIKAISKDWSPETWEQFLKETVEHDDSLEQEDHALVSQAALDCFSESLWEGNDSSKMSQVAKGLRRICRDHLTPRQQQIIRAIFWDSLSEREIANRLGLIRY